MKARRGESIPSIGSEKKDGVDNSSMPSCSSRSSRRNFVGMIRTNCIKKESVVTETIDDIEGIGVLTVEERPKCLGYK